MCLAHGHNAGLRRGSNPQPLDLESSTLPLSHKKTHIIQKHFELSIELFTKYSDFFRCLLYAYMTMSYNKHH